MKWFCRLFSLVITCLLLFFSNAEAEKMSRDGAAAIRQDIALFGEAVVMVEIGGQSRNLALSRGISDSQRMSAVARLQEGLRSSLAAADRKRIVHQFRYVPGAAVRVNAQALERLRKNTRVRHIFENGRRNASLAESTTIVFPGQASSSFDGNNEWSVAVLDTGVDKYHPFLFSSGQRKVVSEACYSRGGYGSQYGEVDSLCPGEGFSSTGAGSGLYCSGYSSCDHGTHVAGIAAGDGAGFNGVASGAKIIAVQVFTGIRDVYGRNVCGTGVGRSCLTAFDVDILHGLERVYALRNAYKIAAVNMSLGGGSYAGVCDGANTLITAAVNNLREAGIATVVASGNEYQSAGISFPACIGSAIAVGATYDSGSMVDRATEYGNQSPEVDLYAPGSYIYSSVPGGGYATMQGTSMAAPHVAGAWAVLKDASPSGSVERFRSLLQSVGPDVASRSGLFTRKRLDLQAALAVLHGGMAPVNFLLLGN